MLITIIWIGASKKGFIAEGVKKYLTQLQKYAKIQIVEKMEASYKGDPSRAIKEETNAIVLSIPERSYVVYLDVAGKSMTTEHFAHFLEDKKNHGEHLTFIIGGAYGVDLGLLQNTINMRLSLSQMTTSHQMVRLFFLEQLYRGLDIIHGGKYHHE